MGEERPKASPHPAGRTAAITRYEDLLKADNPYDSGDVLAKPVNLLQPRLVPDLIAVDPGKRLYAGEVLTFRASATARPHQMILSVNAPPWDW